MLIVENFIAGQEIQVAVLGNKAIGAIELKPQDNFMITRLNMKKQLKPII